MVGTYWFLRKRLILIQTENSKFDVASFPGMEKGVESEDGELQGMMGTEGKRQQPLGQLVCQNDLAIGRVCVE